MEGSVPSETEEEPTRSFSVREAENMGTRATLDSFAPSFEKKKLGDGCALGQTGILKSEQRERLYRSHCRK